MKRLKELLLKYPQYKLLDIGTGFGNFVQFLTEASSDYAEIVGIDTSERAIKMAGNAFQDNNKVKFVQMDANNVEFPDGYFDIVCLSNSLHHLEDIINTLSEMERVLNKNGVILIHEMIGDELSVQQISHKLVHHLSAEIDREFGMAHNDTYTKAEIETVLHTNSQCDIVDSWTVDYETELNCSEEDKEELINIVNRIISRVTDPKRNEYYRHKAENIKQYILKNGYAPATQMMYVLKK